MSENEQYELALADLIDQFARGLAQVRKGEEPRAWRPDEYPGLKPYA